MLNLAAQSRSLLRHHISLIRAAVPHFLQHCNLSFGRSSQRLIDCRSECDVLVSAVQPWIPAFWALRTAKHAMCDASPPQIFPRCLIMFESSDKEWMKEEEGPDRPTVLPRFSPTGHNIVAPSPILLNVLLIVWLECFLLFIPNFISRVS